MLNINHLKLITFIARLKTYLKESRNNYLGLLIAPYIFSLMCLLSSIWRIATGDYLMAISQFIFSILCAFIPVHWLGDLVYKVYNSKTYSLKTKINKMNIYNHNNRKYYIIMKLKNNKYLVQNKNQINNSLDHSNVIYYLAPKMSKIRCTDMMSHPCDKYCHKLVRESLMLLFLVCILVCLVLGVFRYLSGINVLKGLYKECLSKYIR